MERAGAGSRLVFVRGKRKLSFFMHERRFLFPLINVGCGSALVCSMCVSSLSCLLSAVLHCVSIPTGPTQPIDSFFIS